MEWERWNSALGICTWFEAFTGLCLCCDPWFLGSSQFLECAWSLDCHSHLTWRIVQETLICNYLTRAKLCPGVSQQVVSNVKSVAPTMFPSTTAVLFSFKNSSMCHLFLFPIWLFLNLPDEILFLELHNPGRWQHGDRGKCCWVNLYSRNNSSFAVEWLNGSSSF